MCNIYHHDCLDQSDFRICPGSGEFHGYNNSQSNRGMIKEFFLCKDRKFGIYGTMRCDGHIQCDDGSDEKLCNVCPITNERTKTFKCIHRDKINQILKSYYIVRTVILSKCYESRKSKQSYLDTECCNLNCISDGY